MADTYSFDVVSEVNMQEVNNAINQAKKEIEQRYDFKGSTADIVLGKDEITISAENEFKINAVIDVLKGKFAKRGVPIKCLSLGKLDKASLGTVKQVASIIKGISKEKAKEINTNIKTSKLKVQTQIMDDTLRVSGKNKDDLQKVMSLIKSQDFGIELQFTNYR